MNSEKLIELVRVHVELFDLAHPKYVDVSHKEKLWQEIGRELNQTAGNCKSRWNNIRDNYRKHLRKMVNKHGQAPNNIKRYKFSEQLEFLNKYMQVSETICTNTYKESIQVKEEPMEDISQSQNRDRTTSENNHLTEPEDSNREEQEANDKIERTTNKTHITRKRPFASILPAPKRKFQSKQVETASSTLMKYLLEKKDREERACTQQPDAVDTFLASLAPTMKKFSSYYLNIAKTKIFSIVQEFELRMIEEAAPSQPIISRSPSPSLSSSSPDSYPPTPKPSSEVLSSSTHGSFIPTSYLSTTYTTLENAAEQQSQSLDILEPCEEKPQIQ